VSGWDALDRMIEEGAKELREKVLEEMKSMTEDEVKKVVETYVKAQEVLVEVGRLLRGVRGYVIGDRALSLAARYAVIAFDHLVKLAAMWVRMGLEEDVALAAAAAFLFDDLLLTSISVINKAAYQLATEAPKDLVGALEGKRGKRGRRKRKNPPE